MASQGIKGPRYRFLLGNTKEINDMITEAVNNPMEISHQMLPRIMPHVHSWTQIYGMNFLNWYGTRPQLVVTDPELVKEGEKWVKTRKLANQAFHGDCLKAMIPAMVTSVEAMLQRWGLMEDVKEIDVFPEFKILSSEVISRTAFGSSYEEGRNVFGMLMKLGIIVNRNNFKVGIPGIKKLWRSSDDIESDKLQKDIKEGIIKLIRKREDGTSGSGKSYGTDFLGSLLNAYHDSDVSRKITVDDLIDECKSFYVAGHETVTSSLTWTMAMIVNESLRLYPPAFNLTREGEDCHLFKPERFADGVAKATKYDAFLPSGFGPRTCVGMNFAAAETKIALSMLLQRYKLALSPSYVHAPVHMLTICPKHGLPILLQPLQHCILQ
ncbi:Cytochrome P450 CYP749A22 [Linum perenne]